MELERLFGLPAHPLLVHVPVVLLPAAALGAVAIAVSAPLRRRYGWAVVAVAAVAMLGSVLAAGSGEPLEDAVRGSANRALVSDHAQLGEQLRTLSIVFFALVFALVAWDWYQRRQAAATDTPPPGRPERSPVLVGAAVATVVVAALTTIWTLRTGHSGADATWDRIEVSSDGG